jgi:hypothetical protein
MHRDICELVPGIVESVRIAISEPRGPDDLIPNCIVDQFENVVGVRDVESTASDVVDRLPSVELRSHVRMFFVVPRQHLDGVCVEVTQGLNHHAL